jgi:hypothetical protein
VLEIAMLTMNRTQTVVESKTSLGWTPINLFAHQVTNLDDVSTAGDSVAADPLEASVDKLFLGPAAKTGSSKSRINGCDFMSGTPIALLYLPSDTTRWRDKLKVAGKAKVMYRCFTFKDLQRVDHLLRENELVGPEDEIGGFPLAPPGLEDRTARAKCLPPDPRDLTRYILPSLTLIVTHPTILLPPNYEDTMLKSMEYLRSRWNYEKGTKEQGKIRSRSLRIGLHNGRTYMRSMSMVQLHNVTNDNHLSAAHDLEHAPDTRVLDKAVKLEFSGQTAIDVPCESYNDPHVAIVFELEYEIDWVRVEPGQQQHMNASFTAAFVCRVLAVREEFALDGRPQFFCMQRGPYRTFDDKRTFGYGVESESKINANSFMSDIWLHCSMFCEELAFPDEDGGESEAGSDLGPTLQAEPMGHSEEESEEEEVKVRKQLKLEKPAKKMKKEKKTVKQKKDKTPEKPPFDKMLRPPTVTVSIGESPVMMPIPTSPFGSPYASPEMGTRELGSRDSPAQMSRVDSLGEQTSEDPAMALVPRSGGRSKVLASSEEGGVAQGTLRADTAPEDAVLERLTDYPAATTTVVSTETIDAELLDENKGTDFTLELTQLRLPHHSKPLSSFTVSFHFFNLPAHRSRRISVVADDEEAGQGTLLVPDQEEMVTELKAIYRATVAPAEHGPFIEYLFNKTLVLDIWDGSSLFHYGAAYLPLRQLLRQGRPVAQFRVPLSIYELPLKGGDMLTYQQEKTLGATRLAGQEVSEKVSGQVLGTLILLVTNKGFPIEEAHAQQFSHLTRHTIPSVSELLPAAARW